MAKIKDSLGVILMGLCEIVIGVLLLINPAGFTSGIIIGCGWLLLALAAVSIVHYFRLAPAEAAKEQSLAKGLGLAAGGLFCILNWDWFIAAFPLLTLLYGVAILAASLMRIQWTVDALRMKNPAWKWPGASAALALVLALLIVLNPFSTTAFMWTFVALSLIAEAVVDVLMLVFTGKTRRQP